MSAPFTPEQEARLREIIREEIRGALDPMIEAAADAIKRRRFRERMAEKARRSPEPVPGQADAAQ